MVFDRMADSAPSTAFAVNARTPKYQVPVCSSGMVCAVAPGLLMVIDWVSASGERP